MKNISKFLSHLKSFDDNRCQHSNELRRTFDRKEYAEIIAKCFAPCAQAILSGHFRIVYISGGIEQVRKIYPTAIELYYHEEGEGRFKDPIMYHTDDRKNAEHRKKVNKQEYFKDRGIQGLPYFPMGSLNPHTSGIDITFENSEEKYRASFLIRQYRVEYENGIFLDVVNSTDIYDDLLVNGISLCDTDWMEWIDGKKGCEVLRRWRRNVPAYNVNDSSPQNWKKVEAKGENTFSSGKTTFEKCPFNWQFYRK